MRQDAEPATVFETTESAVRTYSRSFPAVFDSASGEFVTDTDGTRYLDFLAGAGSLNYGHNPPFIKRVLLDYIARDGLTNGLDLATTAKQDFLLALNRHVLAPRGLDYKVQFCGPTGTNAVEAALKIARLVTGRTNVISFSGGFHGVSTGSLAATGAHHYKQGLYATLPTVTSVPYPVSPHGDFDSLALLDRLVDDPSSGVEKPAAVLLETIQGEGGVFVAPVEFLRELRSWCDRHQVLLIVDDIQVGCGRTGSFFSFERAGITPDVVTLSKSIGGYGLPMAIVLMRPEYDVWQPGQHNGTFRGNQLAFVAATAAIEEHWADGVDGAFSAEVRRKGELIGEHLRREVAGRFGITVRGTGMIWGLDLSRSGLTAGKLSKLCFDRGLIVETCGRDGEVVKIIPPLTTGTESLLRGLDIVVESLNDLAGGDPELSAEGDVA